MVFVIMTHMSEDADAGAGGSNAVRIADEGNVEAYETDGGIVLYDAGNPLAWVESRAPVRLDDAR